MASAATDSEFSDLVGDFFDEATLWKFYEELKSEFRHHPSMDLKSIFRSIIKKTQDEVSIRTAAELEEGRLKQKQQQEELETARLNGKV